MNYPFLYLKVFLVSESNNIEWNFDLPVEFKSGDAFFEIDLLSDSNNNGILERGESGYVELPQGEGGLERTSFVNLKNKSGKFLMFVLGKLAPQEIM